MKKNYIFLFLLIVFIVFIFRDWFLPGVISSGDLRIFYPDTFKDYFLFPPYAWDWSGQNALGGFASPLAWIYYDLTVPLHISSLFGFSWEVTEKIFFLTPFLIVSIASSLCLIKKLFPRNPFYLLGALIYVCNTYIFMMVGGGQIVGISLAYAIFPLVLLQFVKVNEESQVSKSIYTSLIAGLLYALLIFLDLRFAYMLIGCVFLYFVMNAKWRLRELLLILILPLGVAGLLHAFWVLPVLMSHQNPADALGSAYNSLQSVQFFSFAKLENSISLLHPNWPENIFGKVYFMRPEFLIVPILAFASLFFVSKNGYMAKGLNGQKNKMAIEQYNHKTIIYFALLGLLGAFLAKGANDPFGGIYLWMFNHIPGFVMFRDPSKWYTVVAVSYSILIPFSLWKVSERVSKIVSSSKYKVLKGYTTSIIVFVFVLFWLFTIRQAVVGQLGGTFKSTTIPSEYISFQRFMTIQPQFSRTLWVPMVQRFGYASENHPAVAAENFYNVYDEKSLIKKLRQPGAEKLLQDAGIKYVIVPTDSEKEIFLENRDYSERLYRQTIYDLSRIYWLRDLQITNLVVFEVPNSKNHFWAASANTKVSYKNISPVSYKVSVKNAIKGEKLVFAESYDPHWVLLSSKYHAASSKYDNLLNSFVLPQSGNYSFEVYYESQKWVDVGAVISTISVIVVIGIFLILRLKIKE